MTERFGRPILDLFASPENTQLPRFFAQFPARGAEGVNALRCRGNQESTDSKGGSSVGSILLAQASLVRRPDGPVSCQTLENSPTQDLPQPGPNRAPRSSLVSVDRLALERGILKREKFSTKVIQTIQAARRPSMTRIYKATWKIFCSWCAGHQLEPSGVSVAKVLEFLQDGLDKGLVPNTLKRQVAALTLVISVKGSTSLSQHPRVKAFLRGATNLRPPVVHRYPTWDLPKVLQALTSPPFEPLREVCLRLLTCKVVFLVAITSARRISELAALSIRKDLCVFHADREDHSALNQNCSNHHSLGNAGIDSGHL
ncbi:uncharacterized protein LOC113415103 [Notechis scutatus]|uniref:Uncharacterized protein LOC113415103 n=1 Tax=Notechis scutatus TaxID=8663 RepID=A0A6J1UJS8_9SAUR|nr:uncharacterized protein LOC113415103 [Notechis scutatus]